MTNPGPHSACKTPAVPEGALAQGAEAAPAVMGKLGTAVARVYLGTEPRV